MFTFIKQIGRKERFKSKEREEMKMEFNSTVHEAMIREENIKIIRNLTEEETGKIRETTSVNPPEYRVFHHIQDEEKMYQEDEKSATLMLLDKTIYLVTFPDVETMNLNFGQIEWIKDKTKDITFISEPGFDLEEVMGHQVHVLDRSLDENQRERVRQSLGITPEGSTNLERYCPVDQKITKFIQVEMDQLLGKIQEEKFFDPNLGYQTIDEGIVWARIGRTVQRNYQLDKIQTETFKKNLEIWMISNNLNLDITTSTEEVQNFLKQRLKEVLEDKTEIYKDWLVADSRISGLKIEIKNLEEINKELKEQVLSYRKDNLEKDEMLKSLKSQMQDQLEERNNVVLNLEGRIVQMQNQSKPWEEQAGRTVTPSPRERQPSLGSNSID